MSNGQSPHAPPAAQVSPPRPLTNATGGVPDKNESARVAFYLGIFSILPFFPLGILALVFGISGLRRRKENPAIRGAVHAWTGILVGGFFGLIWLLSLVLMVFFGTSLRRVAASFF